MPLAAKLTLKYVPYFSFNKNCSSPPSFCSQRDDPVQRVDVEDEAEGVVVVVVAVDESVVELVLILASRIDEGDVSGDDGCRDDGISGLNLLPPLRGFFCS